MALKILKKVAINEINPNIKYVLLENKLAYKSKKYKIFIKIVIFINFSISIFYTLF